MLPIFDEIGKDIFGADYPRVSELERLAQLAFVSTHPSVIYAEPLPPNVIPVGGLQIKESKPLPKVCSSATNDTIIYLLETTSSTLYFTPEH